MRIQLSSLRALVLVVGISVLAEAVTGRDVTTDDDVAPKLDAFSEGINKHHLHLRHNDDGLRVDKIVGGTRPRPSSHPYMVLVDRQGDGGKLWSCGGTLIDKMWVLTAGHCVGGSTVVAISRITVKVGAFRLDQPDQYEKTISVEDIVRHHQYNDATLRHDIALLKLKTAAPIDGFRVKTAPLPDDRTRFQWTRCVTAGWGKTVAGKTKPESNVLMEGHMARTTIGECRSRWGKKDVSMTYNVCAIDTRSTPCEGDSGGPLMCFDGRTHVLAGVTSWGDENCKPNVPFLFMKVSEYKGWIKTSTELKNL